MNLALFAVNVWPLFINSYCECVLCLLLASLWFWPFPKTSWSVCFETLLTCLIQHFGKCMFLLESLLHKRKTATFSGSVVHWLQASVHKDTYETSLCLYVLTMASLNDGSINVVSACHLYNQHESLIWALRLHLSAELSLISALNQTTHKNPKLMHSASQDDFI